MWLLADGLPQDQMHNTAWNMKARWDLLDFLPEAARVSSRVGSFVVTVQCSEASK
jgi:hypothetical protein|tara:strand:+ start:323 stop:487 length:165 start_codon:yes stop_codon:yes gene_type:complete